MSVTFGLSKQDAGVSYPDWEDDESVEAYYRALDEIGEFNVANGNAGFILRELLGVDTTEGLWGSMDATTARMRLDSSAYKSGVKPPSQTRGVVLTPEGVGQGALCIEVGRTASQVDSYRSRLDRLVKRAEEIGCEITWG